MSVERVTKLEAAKRQISEAILLFFEERDAVAIHSLASASAQVLSDMLRAKGLYSPFRAGGMVKSELRREWFGVLKRAENFFKHADRDPEAAIEFDPEQTEGTLLEATHMYYWLTGEQIYEGAVFQAWFGLKHPDMLVESEQKATLLRRSALYGVSADDLPSWANLIKARDQLPSDSSSTSG